MDFVWSITLMPAWKFLNVKFCVCFVLKCLMKSHRDGTLLRSLLWGFNISRLKCFSHRSQIVATAASLKIWPLESCIGVSLCDAVLYYLYSQKRTCWCLVSGERDAREGIREVKRTWGEQPASRCRSELVAVASKEDKRWTQWDGELLFKLLYFTCESTVRNFFQF